MTIEDHGPEPADEYRMRLDTWRAFTRFIVASIIGAAVVVSGMALHFAIGWVGALAFIIIGLLAVTFGVLTGKL